MMLSLIEDVSIIFNMLSTSSPGMLLLFDSILTAKKSYCDTTA